MSDIELKIGADPEFFLYKDGKPVSAYGLIGGTKDEPIPVKNGAIQVDGMALEFNIDPASTMQEFNDNIESVLSQLRGVIPPEYEFSFTPVAEFGKEYIADQPEQARRLGCDPDFNAYTGRANPAPEADGSFRTASGHIHLGWTQGQDIGDPEHIEACHMMVKQLDMILGMASVVWDPDNRRRSLYGKAGAYRPKPYGVEYRVMSNVWVNVPWMRNFVYDAAKFAFDQLMIGTKYYGSHGAKSEYINKGMYKSAFETVSYYYYDTTSMLKSVYKERVSIDAKREAALLEATIAAMKNTPNIGAYTEAVAQAQMKRKRPKKPIPEIGLNLAEIQPAPVAPPVVRPLGDWEFVGLDDVPMRVPLRRQRLDDDLDRLERIILDDLADAAMVAGDPR